MLEVEEKKIREMAKLLHDAAVTRKPVEPLTELYSGLTIDDAYAIQMENIRQCVANGEVISGKKIGLTSVGIQKQMGVNEPDYGHLFQAMDCSETGILRFDDFLLPKIEGEIAFCLKEDLKGGNVTAEDVRKATDYVMPAFEIVDSRIADWRIKLIDTVSDNASSGAYVLGEKKAKLSDVDLINLPMKLYENGELIGEGVGSAVLGDPCLAVAWLSNRLWGYGVVLQAGEIVLSGAFSAAPMASKGSRFEASFGELGKVEARFI